VPDLAACIYFLALPFVLSLLVVVYWSLVCVLLLDCIDNPPIINLNDE
jgi:hypothetical protein